MNAMPVWACRACKGGYHRPAMPEALAKRVSDARFSTGQTALLGPVRKKWAKSPFRILRKTGRAGSFWRYDKIGYLGINGDIGPMRPMSRMEEAGDPFSSPLRQHKANREIDNGLLERCVLATRRTISGQALSFLPNLKRFLLSGYEKTLSLFRVLALQMPFAHLGS